MKPSHAICLVGLGLLIGFPVGWYSGLGQMKIRRQQTMENFREMMLASQIYKLAYSNNAAAVSGLLTNQPMAKP